MADATCSVEGCDGVTGVPSTARGLCSKHYNRWLRYGDVTTVNKPNPGKGEANHLWKGADVSYKGLHARVYRRRGKASQYACSHCGVAEPGLRREWATVHGTDGTDPYAHYIPLCVACHRLYDLAKLTLEDREEIKRRIEAGETSPTVAKAFGIHPSVISRGLNIRSPKWATSKRNAA